MDLLKDVLGGRRQEYDEFVERYDKGAPWDGIDDGEAVDRYRQIAPNLSEQDYRQSAEEAFRRLTPQQRAEFATWLQTQGQQRGTSVAFDSDRYDDPSVLAGASARLHQQQPGLFDGLLGGALGGQSAGGGGGGLLSSPIAKAVLAGIAATAASKFIGRR